MPSLGVIFRWVRRTCFSGETSNDRHWRIGRRHGIVKPFSTWLPSLFPTTSGRTTIGKPGARPGRRRLAVAGTTNTEIKSGEKQDGQFHDRDAERRKLHHRRRRIWLREGGARSDRRRDPGGADQR